ncbi:TPA: replication protein B [Yersinia enterocolitica]|uniref:replication protein B n=1 Tax=Yersinia enterocolitica TaxID=630 RepID=UPI001C8D8E7D|nr:replication protein B [Yersinia enterocolitica]MBX9496760.1 replication protein B [Yersinia enterocolitica]
MTVVTLELTRKLPEGLRNVIANHLALPRWNETCNFYNSMSERERLSLCFHAQLKQRHSIMKLQEMNDNDRERMVCAIGELSIAFAERRKDRIDSVGFVGRLTMGQRKTLFFHAQLTEKEFNQPYWYLNDESCLWREKLFRALRELLSLFKQPPTVLTAVKPEQYIH